VWQPEQRCSKMDAPARISGLSLLKSSA
jgi:hypothetical protein